MKSLLYQQGSQIAPALARVRRTEVSLPIRRQGKIYHYVVRDKVTPEDPYLVMVKAAAFARQSGKEYAAAAPSRALRDFSDQAR